MSILIPKSLYTPITHINLAIKMKKKCLLSLIFVGLLTSCNKVTLRSDIAKFIASFSLENSILEYQEAGYLKVTTAVDNFQTIVITEKFDFNSKDVNHPEYKKEVIRKVNDVTESDLVEYLTDNFDGTFTFHKSDDTIETYSLLQAHQLIEKFFYTKVELDGKYHSGGMYYGDALNNTAKSLQNGITIDQENQILKLDVTQKGYIEEGILVDARIIYNVNSLGMILTNNIIMQNDNIKVTTDLSTYKI